MKKLPAPIGRKDAFQAAIFGVAIFGMIVMITWRWLLE